jgi:hypothetical protein
MPFTLVPLNTDKIYPFQRTRYVETVVRNLKANSIFCGFLSAHGKRLNAFGDANGKDFFTFTGNLEQYIRGIPGKRNKRMLDHYLNALANNIIRVTVNSRMVYYAPVANATAFNVGDICYWDNTPKQAKPAAAFTFTTDLPTTQTNFALQFLGICLDKKLAADGQTTLRFDTSPLSCFDQPIAAGTAYKIGQSFGPAKDVGNALLSNKIAACVNGSASFRLVADCSTTDTSVLVAPGSAFFPDNVGAVIG